MPRPGLRHHALRGGLRQLVFDATPYAGAFARYFVRKPFTQTLPRKFKVAFSSCASDCVVAGIHDIGFIPAVQDRDGEEVRGFRMLVGGGLATMPKTAQELYSFVPVSDFLRVSEAILRVFNASQELRKTKFKARIKFLVDWIGIDGLRERVEEELRQEWAREPVDPEPYLWTDDEEGDAPPVLPMSNGHPALDGELSAFSAWRSANVKAQRQAGYFAAEIQLPLGDVQADQFFALADLARRFARGRARTSFQQNLVLRWVREADLLPLWRELRRIGLAEADAGGITDIVSCPGTDSCKLGITSSMGLAKALRETLEKTELGDPLVRKLHIKMSGCPNSCGQHHIADIGFHGGTLKSGGQQLPAYEVFLGGQYMQTGGQTRIGDRIHVRIPAKRVPEALARILGLYTAERRAGEEFGAFYRRAGAAPFEAALQDLNQPGAFNEEPALFVDWSRDTLYELQRGEGECMA
ncbi:MAG: nitrite/sulfite reductase [Candidatus Tectomicrobia bacterium]|nr:nitrite/sulfite reductase [Candidatus Tectomicrobia bacterium]